MSVLWHSLSAEKVFKEVQSSRFGLKSDEVELRLKKFGNNELPREKRYSSLRIFLSQFTSFLIYLLLIAVGISLYLGHYSDAVFILVVLLINTTVGFYQENKANNSLEALKRLVKVRARVTRDGNQKELSMEGLVPGDIVYLRAGDKVPADCFLLESKDAKVNEATLTGEWLAETKKPEILPEKTALAERTNMLHMGTIFESGRATAVVVATGEKTEIGQVVLLVKGSRERPTPLQKKIAHLSKLVGFFVVVVTLIVIVVGLFSGQSWEEIFITALALAVSAIPAGILPAITIILVFGMRRILKSNGLVRKLIANETLGSVSVICTDKTGTLTEGKMEVASILTGSRELVHDGKKLKGLSELKGAESHALALKIATLANEAFVENPDDELYEWVVRGTPTEQALLLAGTHIGIEKRELLRKEPIIDRMSFESDRKFSASLHDMGGKKRSLYVLGAPEVIISKSKEVDIDGKKEKLNSKKFKELSLKLNTLTEKGLRVVACAERKIGTRTKYGEIEELVTKLTLVGFIALKDPLRKDAKDSISLTKKAGIRTIIITGDHRKTAEAIAEEVGIPVDDKGILEGKDIDELSDKDLIEVVKRISICARVSPRHKVRLVEALQAGNEVVAMVGDGVNDAPALKAADVGISVGSGTDVAKEVSDIVLLDNDFGTIVSAVEQGRVIFQNVRKVFVYLIADDFSQLFLFFGAMILGLPLPLLAAQILWINLVESGLPDIALTTEQETLGVMDEPPRSPDEPIMNSAIKWWSVSIFFVSGFAAFFAFYIGTRLTDDIDFIRTFVFALVGLDSLFFAFSVRSFKKSVFRKDIFSNKFLLYATIISATILVIAVYNSFFQSFLSTVSLSLEHWLLIIAISFIEIVIIEFFKKIIFGVQSLTVLKKVRY